MTVRELGEYPLVARLCERLEGVFGVDRRVVVGLSDDAAVIEVNGSRLVLTVDMQLEDVHFRRRWMPPFDLGWKALAISLSDVAAMGGRPLAALFGIGLTGDEPVNFVDAIYDGAIALCRQTSTLLLGGDTVRSPSGLLISSIVVGVMDGEPFRRSGAKVGDAVVVTGFPGEAAAGFWILEEGEKRNTVKGIVETPEWQHCIARFRRPIPRTEAVPILRRFPIHAAIDISDGLVIDAGRIATASKVQIVLSLSQLPLSEPLRSAASFVGKEATELALTGGEDYELLLIVPAAAVAELCLALTAIDIPARCIGMVEEASPTGQVIGVYPDGSRAPLRGGFQHF